MKKVKLFLLLLIISICYSCKSSQIIDTDNFFIMVYDFENNALKDVHVSIDGKEKGCSDVYGRLSLSLPLDNEEHTIQLSKSNYETIILTTTLEGEKVLYYKMGSADYYAALAEKELDEGHYEAATEAINKALTINTRKDYLYLSHVINVLESGQ